MISFLSSLSFHQYPQHRSFNLSSWHGPAWLSMARSQEKVWWQSVGRTTSGMLPLAARARPVPGSIRSEREASVKRTDVVSENEKINHIENYTMKSLKSKDSKQSCDGRYRFFRPYPVFTGWLPTPRLLAFHHWRIRLASG